jgi:hypothetical protein
MNSSNLNERAFIAHLPRFFQKKQGLRKNYHTLIKWTVDLEIFNLNSTPKLIWNVSSGNDRFMFSIEKSIDGIDFKQIGTVRKNPCLYAYNYFDTNCQNENCFYRVKIISKNKIKAVSQVIKFE